MSNQPGDEGGLVASPAPPGRCPSRARSRHLRETPPAPYYLVRAASAVRIECFAGRERPLQGRTRPAGARPVPRPSLARGAGMDPSSSAARPTSMRCMEIRGGSVAVEEAFDTPGLDAWVASRP